MEISSLLLISFLAVTVIGYLALPLYQNPRGREMSGNQLRSSLLAERDRVLDTLLELDMDFEMGKISESRYQSTRSALIVKGAEFMKRLDEIGGQEEVVSEEIDKGQDDELEKLISKRRKALEKDRGKAEFCTKCGEKIYKSDRFCSGCGTPLKSA